ncbi:amino acid permease [Lentilactobacillus buchneri]|uniref:Amino acid permease/ SLC12A domain-containing protein n=1 Tax=Lentilactobacillus buchneri DSM 20057 TaxID=1423728 RepID=A0A4V3A3B9_LENBU|nr:amino acid permease [Lentilactobacillus buchneri]WCJ52804.1 amino acid permease [Lentilactobacillus sp. Egmn17]AEB72304.1 amino acid permease-associated region [Lentilactobacillus buchneri NRRL B-30929]KRK69466.1 amino acid permease-associated protein [Lentilactobacillus buchneri DSM 20057]MCT2882026.1 amino acid permease [Lentilactobacillus buchneri]MCT2898112.1 amino acid permease [Lentilactobacillus buchneri]
MKSKIQENQDGTMRALSNRHVQMIAIGGTIGTGLFLGSGSTISKTGPSVMLIYLVLGLFFFFMMRGIGEMFYSDPSQHTFVSFISRYLGPTVGHFTGWTYWIGLVFVCMGEISATATYVKFWFPQVPAWIIEVIFLGVLAGINLIAARLFGEAEFWFAMIKIVAILALIFTGIFMMFSHSVTPLGHATIGNIFHNFQLFPHGGVSFIAAFPMVFFAFMGIEFVSITIGEAKNPQTVIKKAVNETLIRILIFYIGALTVIMGIIPWSSITPDSSPFVQVLKLAGLPAAAAVINFVVLTSAASSLNSCIFSAGRHFYQLATEVPEDSWMRKTFAKISNNGVPARAIIFSAALVLITPLISLTNSLASVFTIVTGISSDMYIIVYTLAMLAHRKYRQSADFLPNGFLMPAYKIMSPLTIAFFVVIFGSLFFVPEDIIGAVGAIVWTVVFGAATYIHQRRLVPDTDQ